MLKGHNSKIDTLRFVPLAACKVKETLEQFPFKH